MNAAIIKRLEALEAAHAPLIPWNDICSHLAKQMAATQTTNGGYIETPPELLPYGEYFLYVTREDWDAWKNLRAPG